MLLRLPYLALTSVFTVLRLLPMSDTDKDIEILTLRHQLAVLNGRPANRASPGQTALCSPLSYTGSPDPGSDDYS